MLSSTTRVVLGVVGTLMVIGGLSAVAVGGPFGTGGLWLVIAGAVLVVAVVLERQRYEPSGQLEPRFRRTDERFVDPTSGHTMRVYVDPRTGERRYLAEQ